MEQTKCRIKVTYEGNIDTKLDAVIIGLMESIGGEWYAQGKEIESGIRAICFDVEL